MEKRGRGWGRLGGMKSGILAWVGVVGGLVAAAGWAGAASRPERVYLFDLTFLHKLDLKDPAQARLAWDTAHLVASVQGIVNRGGPRLFVRFMREPDDFWLGYLRRPGNWLAGTRVVPIGSLKELLVQFRKELRGVVVYREEVAATSNLASTIAGVEDRICLRFDAQKGSVYQQVMGMGLGFKDELRLFREDGAPLFNGQGTIAGTSIPSTGSAKCDAYLWAKARYMDAQRTSPEYLAYYIDAYWLKHPRQSSLPNFTLTNHDFFIAQRAFFFDLGMWEEESPVDDSAQPVGTDVKALRAILRGMHERSGGKIIHIGGFVPWAWKYTDHDQAGGKHGGVDSEWKYAQIISSYNGVMDADAIGLSGMANASFYQHHPLQERYPQNRRPGEADLRRSGLIRADGSVAPHLYVLFYMGDYDSAAWLNTHVPKWWSDPARAMIPCAWAFNPNLDRRAPHAMDFVRRNQSPNDWFIAGDSGAGYLNPGMLLKENRAADLPEGLEAWVEHNRAYYRRYDLSITGFIIDGHSPEMGVKGFDAYMRFSPDGIVGQKMAAQGVHRETMPFIRMKLDLDGKPEEAAGKIAAMAGINLPKFAVLRTILKSPTWHKQVMDRVKGSEAGGQIRFVDPYTFFSLLKMQEQRKAAGAGGRKSVRFAAPKQVEGLAPVAVDDGPLTQANVAGKAVLRQARPAGVRYLYFEVEDGLVGAKGMGAVVSVVVLDTPRGAVGLEYDSHDETATLQGAYTGTRTYELKGTNQWRTLTFELPEARFGHRQNAGADFRLVNHGAELVVERVEVNVR